jgi:hypothetical protein
MKAAHQKYELFSNWIKEDMRKDRFHVNRKVFSVVFWCLILPSLLLITLVILRRYQWIGTWRYVDLLIYIPALGYTIYSMWPTFRDIPKVFKKGGMNSMLEESSKEVEWRESTVTRLNSDLNFTGKEWKMIGFHLRFELQRLKQQNWYMSILAAVVLFFMFQFLDFGSATVTEIQPDHFTIMKGWLEQFIQWGLQVITLVLFIALFYLSGLQFQRHLDRYLVCVERILIEDED